MLTPYFFFQLLLASKWKWYCINQYLRFKNIASGGDRPAQLCDIGIWTDEVSSYIQYMADYKIDIWLEP